MAKRIEAKEMLHVLKTELGGPWKITTDDEEVVACEFATAGVNFLFSAEQMSKDNWDYGGSAWSNKQQVELFYAGGPGFKQAIRRFKSHLEYLRKAIAPFK